MAAKKKTASGAFDPTKSPARLVDEIPVTRYMEEYNSAYMLYSVSDRALPLVSSGVKPGAQRLLYSMFREKITPDAKPRKSAKITSTATGTLHPHGQSAMYGTLVTLAAPYGRVQLIDGIGSFGQTPGDVPAADRYTEARLSPAGYEIVREIAQGSVPMRPSYDGEIEEPWHLPSRFPVLLCVGATGIGEGWATNTPSHNPREVMAAARAMLANPDITVDELLDIMPGPDWGTGARVIGNQDGIRSYFETGRGHMTVRSRYEVEGREIHITEVPPNVSVPTLLNGKKSDTRDTRPGLKDLVRQGVISGVSDVTDLSDLDSGLNLKISVKRGHKVDDVLEQLFRETDLEATYPASTTALTDDFVPQWWSVPELLREFLNMRDRVVVDRSKTRLDKIESQLEHVRALTAVALDKQRVADLVLNAEDKAAAVAALTAHTFTLDSDMAPKFDLDSTQYHLEEEQAQYIVEMSIHRLTKSDSASTIDRLDALLEERGGLRELIEDKGKRDKVVDDELVETSKIFDDPQYDRRTTFEPDTKPLTGQEAELSDGEALALWRLDPDTGLLGEVGDKLTEDDLVWATFSDGRVRLFGGAGLPKRISPRPLSPDISDLLNCGSVRAESESFFVFITAGTNKQNQAKAIKFPIGDVSVKGIASNGIAGLKVMDGDHIVHSGVYTDDQNILMVSRKGHKVMPVSEIPVKGRGGQGVGVFKHVSGDELVEVAVGGGDGFIVNGSPAKVSKREGTPVRKPVEEWKTA